MWVLYEYAEVDTAQMTAQPLNTSVTFSFARGTSGLRTSCSHRHYQFISAIDSGEQDSIHPLPSSRER